MQVVLNAILMCQTKFSKVSKKYLSCFFVLKIKWSIAIIFKNPVAYSGCVQTRGKTDSNQIPSLTLRADCPHCFASGEVGLDPGPHC